MGLVWYVWPVNFILGGMIAVALLTGLWLLGHHIRRTFTMRADGLRVRDLIALELQIEEIEASVRRFCDRQENMLKQLHDMITTSRRSERPRDETREHS